MKSVKNRHDITKGINEIMASLLTGKCSICTVQTENDLSVGIWATQ